MRIAAYRRAVLDLVDLAASGTIGLARLRREVEKLGREPWKPRQAIARRDVPRARSPRRSGSYRERIKYANDLWRKLIYLKRPTGLCAVCGTRPFVEAMHGFIKGRYPHVRFDLDNGAPGCRACHRMIDSDHHAKETFWRRYIGDRAYETLGLRALGKGKLDLAATIVFLEQYRPLLTPHP